MLKIYILGRFLNLLFSQTGNVYTGVRLKKDFGVTYTKFISGHTSMTWIDLVMNLSMAFLLIIFLQPSLLIGSLVAWQLIGVLAVCVATIPFVVHFLIRKMKFSHKRLIWAHNKIIEVVATTVEICKDPQFLTKVFALGVLLLARTCVVFSIYFLCFGSDVSISVLAVFYVLFKLSSFIVITPGNIGVQEFIFGFLSEQVGIGMAQGILVSTLVRVVGNSIIIAMGFGLGGAELIRQRKDFEQPVNN